MEPWWWNWCWSLKCSFACATWCGCQPKTILKTVTSSKIDKFIPDYTASHSWMSFYPTEVGGMSPIFFLKSSIILINSTIYPGCWHCPCYLSNSDIFGCDQCLLFLFHCTVGTSENPFFQSCSGVAVCSHVQWLGENWQRRHSSVE